MKNNMTLSLCILASLSLLVACTGVKDPKNSTDDVLKKIEQDNQEAKKKLDDILNNPVLVAGGQPGKISVYGIIVSKDEKNPELDQRIKVSQVPGKASVEYVTTLVAESSKAVLSPNTEAKGLEKLSADKTYVNLNCPELDPALVDGLTEVEAKPASEGILTITANTVIACGEVPAQANFIFISADHLILTDVNSTLPATLIGSIALSANKLTLIGENKFSTTGSDASGVVIQGPGINLTVAKEIAGEGSLQLTSTGGNNLKYAEKK